MDKEKNILIEKFLSECVAKDKETLCSALFSGLHQHHIVVLNDIVTDKWLYSSATTYPVIGPCNKTKGCGNSLLGLNPVPIMDNIQFDGKLKDQYITKPIIITEENRIAFFKENCTEANLISNGFVKDHFKFEQYVNAIKSGKIIYKNENGVYFSEGSFLRCKLNEQFVSQVIKIKK